MTGIRFPRVNNPGRRLRDRRGFTLLESLATIVIAGIIAMMIIPYFQSGITESHRPAVLLQDAVALNRVMENMNAVYRNYYQIYHRVTCNDLRALSVNIGAENTSTGHPGNFGEYTVLENHFISFTNGNEQYFGAGGAGSCPPSPEPRVLKVTIRSNTNPGYQLTQLFTFLQAP